MVGTTHIHHYGVLNIFQLLYIPFHYQRLRFLYYIPVSPIILPIKYYTLKILCITIVTAIT